MSDIVVTVKSGTSKRLLTSGKYCYKNIVVVAESGDGEIIRDYDLIVRFYDANGEIVRRTGYYQINNGAMHEFNSLETISLLDSVDADSVVKIVADIAENNSYNKDNCNVVYNAGSFTVSDFTGNAHIDIWETFV